MSEEQTSQPDAEDTDSTTELAVEGEVLPGSLYILPTFERPFFPSQAQPLIIDEDAWLETIRAIGEAPQHVAGLILVTGPPDEELAPQHFAKTGVIARIHDPRSSDDRIQLVAEGIRRFRVTRWLSKKPPFLAQVEYPEDKDTDSDSDELRAYAMALINNIRELIPLNPLYSEELKHFLKRFSPNEPSLLADFAASLSTAPKRQLQAVLDAVPLIERMEKVLVLIKKELEVVKLQGQIRERVEEQMSEQQRQFFLREQLKIIQQELGISKDDRTADLDFFRERLEGRTLPEPAQKRVDEELDKLAVLETGSPEYAVTRNYLDIITGLPWGKHTTDQVDLERARKILDRDHDGLEDVKDRILEFIAVGALTGEVAGSILLLVGPPGVGKTSIGRSVADALGRKFYRFSVGGMQDEAEIKGHRRTYIGAMPGKPLQALREVDVCNPVIMLDEIDKVGASYRGDPASALLEVLDPEQNVDFLDHYLDVRFDLSKVLFICTANQLDTIPAPLLDRMETIRLSGYITAEKVEIARHHLWPRQLERAGLKRGKVSITPAALRGVVEGYAREAGVRRLEQQLANILRKVATKRVHGEKQPIRIGRKQVKEYLGKPIFRDEPPLRGIGVVMGLAWTSMGGATLPVEASLIHTKNRGFKLTGQLGDVMRESAEIAYSFVASQLSELHGDPSFFDEAFVHLHVPEGATPKDGPSAGITMATALLSLARNQAIRRPLAMTGELTLTGHVFPVGGIREKIIAARRIGILELILPETNRRDFEDLPEHIREGVTIHFAKKYQDVAAVVFGD